MSAQYPIPADWNEQMYLDGNPDVANAVSLSSFTSGWDHYMPQGRDEGRPYPKKAVDPAAIVNPDPATLGTTIQAQAAPSGKPVLIGLVILAVVAYFVFK
jgi:hypothetical protein